MPFPGTRAPQPPPIFTDTVTIVRAPLVTGYGNSRTYDWDHAARATTKGFVPPGGSRLSGGSTEATGGRDQITTTRRVVLPGTAEVKPVEWVGWNGTTWLDTVRVEATDRIEWNGTTYEVEGKPGRWPVPVVGGIHHIEITLSEVVGG